MAAPSPQVVVAILAAGLGTRMPGRNKLLELLDGRPLLRHVAEAALASGAASVVAVLGHEAERARAVLAGLPLDAILNPDYEEGMAASIRCAVKSHGAQASAMIYCLGDMPRVTPEVLDALIEAHAAHPDAAACQPVFGGRRGNPVLWSARVFDDLRALSGAEGARSLLKKYRDEVRDVAVACAGILLDVDTPDDLAALTAQAARPA